MSFRSFVFPLALGCATFCATQSLAITYDCKLKDGSDGGAVPPQIILALDEEHGAASAYDAYINHLHKNPIPVTYKREGENRHRFDWTLENIKFGNRSYIITYSARVNPKSLTITLNGRLHGFDNQIRGYGKCEVAKT